MAFAWISRGFHSWSGSFRSKIPFSLWGICRKPVEHRRPESIEVVTPKCGKIVARNDQWEDDWWLQSMQCCTDDVLMHVLCLDLLNECFIFGGDFEIYGSFSDIRSSLKTEPCHWWFMHCLAGLLSSWNMGGMYGFLAVIFMVDGVSRSFASRVDMSGCVYVVELIMVTIF